VIAVLGGLVLLFTVPGDRSDGRVALDAALGAACVIALWWRRSHPAAVGIGTTLVSIVSASAGMAGLIALSARRYGRRARA
jgi:hypothetical protein